jgi:thiamine pyrophosphate-dependent acetolactate synthase large subunit-like protein
MLNSKISPFMLGKEAIARFFQERKGSFIAYLPGIHTLPLNAAFKKYNIHAISGRHESNIGFMADGFARAAGGIGTVIATPGPGLGNLVSPCMEAFGDDVPLVVLHIATDKRGIGTGALHEVREPEKLFAHVSKQTMVVEQPAQLVPYLQRAYATALSARPGPVVLSIPYTFLEKEVPYEKEAIQEARKQSDFSLLEEALGGKCRPVIVGGAHLMDEQIRPILSDLCINSSIPFLSSTAGKGVLREDSGICFGNITKKGTNREIFQRADVVIALGTRLRDSDSKKRGVKIGELIHIDVDEGWVGKNYTTRVGLAAEMGEAVRALQSLMKGKRSEWDIEKLQRDRKAEEAELESRSPGFRTISLIREVIPEEAITVWDLNLPAYWAEYYFPVIHQRTFLAPRGISTIFYAVPAAIGAKKGRPDRACLCITGDGAALPGLPELATVRAYDIPVVFLVCNNGSFGVLEGYMKKRYAIEGSMTLTNPDYVRLASAFDIKGKSATTLEELRNIFLKDVTWDEPFLIDFKCPVIDPPW